MSEFELHPDRLSTSDADGKRLYVYPADVKGFFRTQRTRIHYVLIAVFLLLPWFRINGRQALLFDIPSRHFEIFGLSLRAHNAPLLIFVFASAAFGLFFATAVFGRVWCGWACPQTVFIDAVFRKVERWIEGPATKRKQLEKSNLNLEKFIKKTSKWFIFICLTLVLTHSFLAYFVGTEKLREMISESPSQNWGTFLFMLISSSLILFDFGWFREQFCTVLCPYGRFQSVLMDKSSLIVFYDALRGEPRATAHAKNLARLGGEKLGDCVNCYRCVQVCPTGIDIRRGVQMECIACTSCIDACDDVMAKIKKPAGLIRYDNLVSKSPTKKSFNFRAFLYLVLCISSILALFISLSLMKPVDVEIRRASDVPYELENFQGAEAMVMNHFKLELSNQSAAIHSLEFSTDSANIEIIVANQPISVAVEKIIQADVFIRFPKSLLMNGQKKIELEMKDTNEQNQHAVELKKEVNLVGPLL